MFLKERPNLKGSQRPRILLRVEGLVGLQKVGEGGLVVAFLAVEGPRHVVELRLLQLLSPRGQIGRTHTPGKSKRGTKRTK